MTSNGNKTGGGKDGGGVIGGEGLDHGQFFTVLQGQKEILFSSIPCETRCYKLCECHTLKVVKKCKYTSTATF